MVKVDYINSAHSQIVTIILEQMSNKIQHIVICINHAKNILAQQKCYFDTCSLQILDTKLGKSVIPINEILLFISFNFHHQNTVHFFLFPATDLHLFLFSTTIVASSSPLRFRPHHRTNYWDLSTTTITIMLRSIHHHTKTMRMSVERGQWERDRASERDGVVGVERGTTVRMPADSRERRE
jgi:hypothetical protein